METLTWPSTGPAVPGTKSRVRWRRWLVIFSIGVFGLVLGWKEAGLRYPNDSQADVQAVETAIAGLLEAAASDNMPQIIQRDEFVAATGNLSQAMSKLLGYASSLESERRGTTFSPLASGFVPAYPNYNAAWEDFLTTFGRLHTRSNRLKATVLYYDAAGWYPKPPTDDHDWRKLNQAIPWNLSGDEIPERVGYAVGYGGALAAFAWLAIALLSWAWKFVLARIRDLSNAVRGR